MTYTHSADQAALERMQRTVTYHFAYNLCRACTELQKKNIWVREDLQKVHSSEVHHIRDDQVYVGIQFFSQKAAALIKEQRQKVWDIIKNNCIKYAGGDVYIIHPIPKYNKRTYRAVVDGESISCDCQKGRKNDTPCVHYYALHEFWARGQGRG
jgi:hypothetical protein